VKKDKILRSWAKQAKVYANDESTKKSGVESLAEFYWFVSV
jgi:hypothetical protein